VIAQAMSLFGLAVVVGGVLVLIHTVLRRVGLNRKAKLSRAG